jgi:Na+-driven multidrug efflux pump
MHAALAVGFRLDLLAIFTGAGWGGAAAAMVGQALGQGDRGRAERAGWAATVYDVLTMTGIGIFYYLYAPWLVSVFSEDRTHVEFTRMHDLAVEYIEITVLAYAFAAIAITLAHALNGAGSTKTPLVLDSIVLALQLPIAAYICLRHAEHGYTRSTLWWSLVLTTVVAAALYALVWERGHWKHKQVQ